MGEDYEPIARGAYDGLEVMAMHRAEVELVHQDESGVRHAVAGRVLDTLIADGAEYLVLEVAGERQQFRLDRIVTIDDRVTGKRWRQNYGD